MSDAAATSPAGGQVHRCRSRWVWVLPWVAGAVGAFALAYPWVRAGGYGYGLTHKREMVLFAVVPAAVMAPGCLYCLFRILRFPYYLEWDDIGLRVHRMLTETSLRWDQIESYQLEVGVLSAEARFRLVGPGGARLMVDFGLYGPEALPLAGTLWERLAPQTASRLRQVAETGLVAKNSFERTCPWLALPYLVVAVVLSTDSTVPATARVLLWLLALAILIGPRALLGRLYVNDTALEWRAYLWRKRIQWSDGPCQVQRVRGAEWIELLTLTNDAKRCQLLASLFPREYPLVLQFIVAKSAGVEHRRHRAFGGAWELLARRILEPEAGPADVLPARRRFRRVGVTLDLVLLYLGVCLPCVAWCAAPSVTRQVQVRQALADRPVTIVATVESAMPLGHFGYGARVWYEFDTGREKRHGEAFFPFAELDRWERGSHFDLLLSPLDPDLVVPADTELTWAWIHQPQLGPSVVTLVGLAMILAAVAHVVTMRRAGFTVERRQRFEG